MVPGLDDADVLRAAASLQSGSEHPLARAVVQAAQDQALALLAPDTLRPFPGAAAKAAMQGQSYLLGSLRWMDELGVALGPLAERATVAGRRRHAVGPGAAHRAGAGVAALMALVMNPNPARARRWRSCVRRACAR